MRPARSEAGYTLVEVLVTVAILAIVMPVVAGSLFLGIKTLGATESRTTSSIALAALTKRFSDDVADAVAVDDAAPGCAVVGDTFVHLLSDGVDVYYSIDTDGGAVTRTACPTGLPTSSLVGVLRPSAAGPASVSLLCGDESTPCGSPREVTLSVHLDPEKDPIAVTAMRRVDQS